MGEESVRILEPRLLNLRENPATMARSEEILLRTPDVLVRSMRLGPREAVPWHLHTAVGDIVVCLSGLIELRFSDVKRRVTLAPGQRDRVPARTVHQVVNLAETDSEYLLIQGVGAYDFVAAEPPSPLLPTVG